MNRLKQHKDLLMYLAKASQPSVKAVLRTLDSDEVNVIGEILANLLAGAIKLGSANKTAISQHADVIRNLARRQIKTRTRQRLLVKHSEVLTLILKSLIKKLFNNGNGKRTG